MTTPQSMRERLLHSAAALQQVTSEEDEQQALQDFNGIVEEIEAAARAEGHIAGLREVRAALTYHPPHQETIEAIDRRIAALTPTNPPNTQV